MAYRTFLTFIGCVFLAAVPAQAQGKIVVAHFGDSTCICSYLQPDQRADGLLEKKLLAHYRGQAIDNVNVAMGGEFIRQLLDGGRGLDNRDHSKRYETRIKPRNRKIDIALLRYGQNDWKLEQRTDIAPDGYSEKEFRKDVISLIETLRKDYPGVHIVLETGTYFADNSWTGKKAQRYWDAVRALAKELNLPLVDNSRRWEREVKQGKTGLLNGGHPTAEGVRLHADEEFEVFKKLWPTRLPRAGEDLRPTEKPASKAKAGKKTAARTPPPTATPMGALREKLAKLHKLTEAGKYDDAIAYTGELKLDDADAQAAVAALRWGLDGLPSLRKRVADAIRKGKSLRVYMRFGGTSIRGRALRANEKEIEVNLAGNTMSMPWNRLLPVQFFSLAAGALEDDDREGWLLLAAYGAACGLDNAKVLPLLGKQAPDAEGKTRRDALRNLLLKK